MPPDRPKPSLMMGSILDENMGTDLPVMTAIKFWLRIEPHVIMLFTAFSIAVCAVGILSPTSSKRKQGLWIRLSLSRAIPAGLLS
jgi:hypothetical protein